MALTTGGIAFSFRNEGFAFLSFRLKNRLKAFRLLFIKIQAVFLTFLLFQYSERKLIKPYQGKLTTIVARGRPPKWK